MIQWKQKRRNFRKLAGFSCYFWLVQHLVSCLGVFFRPIINIFKALCAKNSSITIGSIVLLKRKVKIFSRKGWWGARNRWTGLDTLCSASRHLEQNNMSRTMRTCLKDISRCWCYWSYNTIPALFTWLHCQIVESPYMVVTRSLTHDCW